MARVRQLGDNNIPFNADQNNTTNDNIISTSATSGVPARAHFQQPPLKLARGSMYPPTQIPSSSSAVRPTGGLVIPQRPPSSATPRQEFVRMPFSPQQQNQQSPFSPQPQSPHDQFPPSPASDAAAAAAAAAVAAAAAATSNEFSAPRTTFATPGVAVVRQPLYSTTPSPRPALSSTDSFSQPPGTPRPRPPGSLYTTLRAQTQVLFYHSVLQIY